METVSLSLTLPKGDPGGIGPPGPSGSFVGLLPYNDVNNPAKSIGVSPGSAVGKDNVVRIVLKAAMTKRIDATWAPGSGNGGRDQVATFPNATGVHIHLIRNPETEREDVLYSLSATNPIMPAGFTQRVRLGAFIINSAGNICPGRWYADGTFLFAKAVEHYASFSIAAPMMFDLFVPKGVKLVAKYFVAFLSGGSDFGVVFRDPDLSAPPFAIYDSSLYKPANIGMGGAVESFTDTSGRVYLGTSSGVTASVALAVRGWRDLREEFE